MALAARFMCCLLGLSSMIDNQTVQCSTFHGYVPSK